MTASTRIEMRCDPAEKAILAKAAALKGMKMTPFVLELALECARQVIEESERIAVDETSYNRVLELLDNPPKPTKALRDALRAHQAAGL